MTPQIGKLYYRRAKSGYALVVRIVAADEWVDYEVVHGPRRLKAIGRGRCKTRNFQQWEPIEECEDYSHLDGCKIFSTYLLLNTLGEPILRCSQKRLTFYLKKGLIVQVEDGVYQFTDDKTENRLRELYPTSFSEFFMAVKNDRCVCCGSSTNLTRHHVIPQRHKKMIPQPWRKCLSNVLFLCQQCHQRYEETSEPAIEVNEDWQEYARSWRSHFEQRMQPQFMPAGWDIISVQNFDALKDETSIEGEEE